MKTGLAALVMLLAISCKKESVSTPSFASIKTEDNAAIKTGGHYIGEHFGGGVIFWISKDSLHGLIADTVDLGITIPWNGTYTTTGATGIVIFSGKANTRKIILSQGKPGSYAALLCANYNGSGYTDWVLPSKGELNELYKQKNIVGGFADIGYWSSTEFSYDGAWVQRFNNGFRVGYNKGADNVDVRAIRAF